MGIERRLVQATKIVVGLDVLLNGLTAGQMVSMTCEAERDELGRRISEADERPIRWCTNLLPLRSLSCEDK